MQFDPLSVSSSKTGSDFPNENLEDSKITEIEKKVSAALKELGQKCFLAGAAIGLAGHCVHVIMDPTILHGKSIVASASGIILSDVKILAASSLYGAIFTLGTSLLAWGIREHLLENFPSLKNYRFTLPVLTHTLGGALACALSILLAQEVALPAIASSVPCAAIFTLTALISYLYVRSVHFPVTQQPSLVRACTNSTS